MGGFRRGAMACVAVLAVAALPGGAAADPGGADVPVEMLAAMQRDLGLTVDQARARMAAEVRAGAVENVVARRLGDDFGGAWLADGRLMVGITNPARAAEVRAAGGEPRVVGSSYRQLTGLKARLDRAAQVPETVHGWYVDVESNSVAVRSDPAARLAAVSFAASAGVPVKVVDEAAPMRPLHDVQGGDTVHIAKQRRCSIGFPVIGGFVTAGHCGRAGETTTGYNQVDQGVVRASVFPGFADFGWVAVNANWTPRPVVNKYDGTLVEVAGSQEAPVKASVCRSGLRTKWRCGVIENKNETVRYPQGTVTGMTRTSACAEPGDSGGPYLTDQQGQGVTSGGSGNCTIGGKTIFQPLREILGAYKLSLLTRTGSEPPPVCTGTPDWSATEDYRPGDIVGHLGNRWRSTYPSTNAEPSDPTSWAVWKEIEVC